MWLDLGFWHFFFLTFSESWVTRETERWKQREGRGRYVHTCICIHAGVIIYLLRRGSIMIAYVSFVGPTMLLL